jgi:hypothetical protein
MLNGSRSGRTGEWQLDVRREGHSMCTGHCWRWAEVSIETLRRGLDGVGIGFPVLYIHLKWSPVDMLMMEFPVVLLLKWLAVVCVCVCVYTCVRVRFLVSHLHVNFKLKWTHDLSWFGALMVFCVSGKTKMMETKWMKGKETRRKVTTWCYLSSVKIDQLWLSWTNHDRCRFLFPSWQRYR